MLEWKKERVSPRRAQELLDTMVQNRNVRGRKVRQFAAAMERGEWQSDNPQPISLNKQGNLIDGQHRLLAVIQAKRTLGLWIAYGVPEHVTTVMDTGASRSLSDVLQMNGEVNTAQLAGALRQVHLYRSQGLLGGKATNEAAEPTSVELVELLAQEPGIREAVRHTHNWSSRTGFRLPPSLLAAAFFLFAEVDQGEAEAFFEQLRLGEGLKRGDPIFALRRLLHSESSRPARARRTGALLIKTWNAWREGEEIVLLAWRGGGENPEPFPEI